MTFTIIFSRKLKKIIIKQTKEGLELDNEILINTLFNFIDYYCRVTSQRRSHISRPDTFSVERGRDAALLLATHLRMWKNR